MKRSRAIPMTRRIVGFAVALVLPLASVVGNAPGDVVGSRDAAVAADARHEVRSYPSFVAQPVSQQLLVGDPFRVEFAYSTSAITPPGHPPAEVRIGFVAARGRRSGANGRAPVHLRSRFGEFGRQRTVSPGVRSGMGEHGERGIERVHRLRRSRAARRHPAGPRHGERGPQSRLLRGLRNGLPSHHDQVADGGIDGEQRVDRRGRRHGADPDRSDRDDGDGRPRLPCCRHRAVLGGLPSAWSRARRPG
ncbi:hypothetical protein QE411_001742 [Microbacterium arborescens]|nr:hypothetical protein [Microbacterium arborescens]